LKYHAINKLDLYDASALTSFVIEKGLITTKF